MNGRPSCAPIRWCLRSGISVPLRWKWLLIRLGMLQGKEEDVELLLADLRLTQSYICQSYSNTSTPSPADECSFALLTPSSLPPPPVMAGDVIPAPFQITENDKRGLIVVTAGCTLAFVWVCFIIRVWLRLQVREWRSDDYFLAAATVSLRLDAWLRRGADLMHSS